MLRLTVENGKYAVKDAKREADELMDRDLQRGVSVFTSYLLLVHSVFKGCTNLVKVLAMFLFPIQLLFSVGVWVALVASADLRSGWGMDGYMHVVFAAYLLQELFNGLSRVLSRDELLREAEGDLAVALSCGDVLRAAVGRGLFRTRRDGLLVGVIQGVAAAVNLVAYYAALQVAYKSYGVSYANSSLFTTLLAVFLVCVVVLGVSDSLRLDEFKSNAIANTWALEFVSLRVFFATLVVPVLGVWSLVYVNLCCPSPLFDANWNLVGTFWGSMFDALNDGGK
jgi:hypothetical protein